MAKTRYKKSYCDEIVSYFLKFIEMRDEPDRGDEAERHGMVHVTIENGKATKNEKPCSGYPTLTKFAIKIGVTPRTITNWRQKYPEFDEACEFADQIQDDILSERALFGDVDGRVAMKIRELKANAKRSEDDAHLGGFQINIKNYSNETIELKEYEEDVSEDTGYTTGG